MLRDWPIRQDGRKWRSAAGRFAAANPDNGGRLKSGFGDAADETFRKHDRSNPA
jgi:hypothetical protein